MNNWLYNNILTFVLAFILVGILIPQIIAIAFNKNLFDSQDARKTHIGLVPRLGGISFVPGIIFSLLFTLGIGIQFAEPGIREILWTGTVPLFFLFCALMLLYLVGMADDLVGVRYGAKFFFQILAALIVIASGIYVANFHRFLWIDQLPVWASWALTIVLIVYIINSFNLIDGIDGLSGGLATITLAFFGIAFYDAGIYIYSMLAFAGLGTLLPFLYYNIYGNPERNSKIFMGDTGSLTIGMLIAFLAIEFTNVNEKGNIFATVNPIIVAVSPIIIPLFDQLRVFSHRIVRGRNPFMPDRCHIHHKLLALGLTSRQALVAILLSDIGFIVVNWLISPHMGPTLTIVVDLAIWTIANLIITKALRRREAHTGIHLYD